ncbi:hypothetical protein SAMN06297229_1806 [Pseudidiomarina planktonica]|uniref:Uncharacterized protein n=1 Tax=Pseudidiomarina planktonica TaxID=1323738 RepID=A0A1Y6FWZ4_9GAMM|nr:hypothetical protein SAMN06297229_1806 [Pseudidiomarina planktonica]
MVSRANCWPQAGQWQGVSVKSSAMRSIKHFTSAPLPPLRYLNNGARQAAQVMSTVRNGCFLRGLEIINSELLTFKCEYFPERAING